MNHISLTLTGLPAINQETYKSKRDQLIKEAVENINSLRKGTKYKKETVSNLAKRINMNPFLAGKSKDGELELVLKECSQKKNYSKLYWMLK